MQYHITNDAYVVRKKTIADILSKRNVSVLVIVVATGLLLSIFSYQYSSFTSDKIINVASQEIRSNAKIEVHDVSQILANKLQSIGDILQTLAGSPAIHNNEYNRADIIINARQRVTSDLTDFYMWLDKNGRINWISNINQSTYQKYKGTDLSYRAYFSVPRDTHTEYYSSLIESNDKVPRLYISYPVLNTTSSSSTNTTITGRTGGREVFTGVVVASIRLETLGSMLESQLFREFHSSIALLDRNGVILYSNSPLLHSGKNIFGNEMQSNFSSVLSSPTKDSLNNLFENSLQGSIGSQDISAQGKTNTIAYEPVMINGKYFLTSYIIAPHNLASDVKILADQQKNFSTFIMAIIGVVGFGIAFLVLLWNKRLGSTVNARTAELKGANDSLTESNRLLAGANEQLKVHDKMQKEFINIASHELRTPIQPIVTLTEIIRTKTKEPQQQELLDITIRNAKRLKRLTDDILDVSKIESQSLNLRKERFNLKDAITNSISDIVTNRYMDKDNKINTVKIISQSQDVFVEADKGRITQVISNLLDNAVKFTENNITKRMGTINITTEKIDSRVHVSIKDTGSGIDPEILPRLFEKFVSRSFQGTGLGLFICRSIVEAHGGKIWAQNNSDGKGGAIFTFSLPLYQIEIRGDVTINNSSLP
jgi:signal transduction histidine kinase